MTVNSGFTNFNVPKLSSTGFGISTPNPNATSFNTGLSSNSIGSINPNTNGLNSNGFSAAPLALDPNIGSNLGSGSGINTSGFFNSNNPGFNFDKLTSGLNAGAAIATAFGGFKSLAEAKRQAQVNEQLARANFAANRNVTNQQLATQDLSRQNIGFNDGLTHDQFLAKYSIQPLSSTSG